MKATFVLISFALLYAHVARGMPTADDKAKEKKVDVPQAAPAAEKPETCTATIDGKEQTLQTGERYCIDDTTHRVCNYGEWIDNKCPDASKCLKSPTSYQVLCRIVNKNPPQVIPQNADIAPQSDNPAKASNPAPAPKDEPKPAAPAAPVNPAPAPEQPSNPAPPPPPPKTDDKPAPPAPKPEDNPSPAPEKPTTCKATIDGKEQILQAGDRYCLSDSTNRVCNYGEFVDFECPNASKCLKSPNKWEVLCRVINKNPTQNAPSDNQ